MKKIYKKASFTLIEIMICLSLLSLVGGVFALRGKDLFDTFLFRQELTSLNKSLNFAKSAAFCYQTDVYVYFHIGSRGLICEFKTDEPGLLKHPLFLSKKHLKTIGKVESKDAFFLETMSLIFLSSGWQIGGETLSFESIRGRKGKFSI
jgi:hypothetical protein